MFCARLFRSESGAWLSSCSGGRARAAALARERSLAGKRGVLACEASYGRVSPGEDGSPPWRIELSTLPARTGQRLLPVDAPRGAEEMAREYGGGVRMGAFPPEGGWRLLPA